MSWKTPESSFLAQNWDVRAMPFFPSIHNMQAPDREGNQNKEKKNDEYHISVC